MNAIRRYLPFAAVLGSLATLLAFEYALLSGGGRSAVRILAVILFLFDFYLCAEFFAGILRHPLRLVLRHLRSPEGIIELLSTVPLFIISLLTLLDAAGFVAADNAAEQSPFILFYFTAIHPYARLIYLARIVRAGTSAIAIVKSDLVRTAVLRIASVLGVSLLTAAIALYLIVYAFILPKLDLSPRVSAMLITYDLTGQTFIDNPYLTAEFARKFGITLMYRDQRSVFEETDAKHVLATHCLFEMQSVTGNRITAIRPARMFRLPISVLVMIFMAVYGVLAAAIMYALKRSLERSVLSAVNVMRRGFEDPQFNRHVDTTGLPEEIAALAGHYGEKFIAYKYRDRFIGSSR